MIALPKIVDLSAKLEQVATGFDFLEGPIWHPYEKSIIFSDILGNAKGLTPGVVT